MAVRAVWPKAPLEIKMVDSPIRVVLKETTTGRILFDQPQRNLFRKYPDARSKSIEEIKRACSELKG